MGGKETIECQINCFLIKHFYKTVDNKVIGFPLHSTDLTYNIDQVYFNTRVPTQVNTNQHESTRINTSLTRVNMNQHEYNTNQHKSDTSQHESDTN